MTSLEAQLKDKNKWIAGLLQEIEDIQKLLTLKEIVESQYRMRKLEEKIDKGWKKNGK